MSDISNVENVLYFNSTRNYTLAIINALNNIKHWVPNETGGTSEEVIPITFGNYEKTIALEDIDKADGQYNYLPRLVLSFDGLTKMSDRDTSKYKKFSKNILTDDGSPDGNLQFAHNSVAYDFQFNLTLQARGLNQAFQIVEQILPMFNPTMHMQIQEYPLIEATETQLLIEDPSFEILDSFESTDINIINVTFPLTVRGNLYMPLSVVGRVKVVHLFNWLWDTKNIKESQLASYYGFDVCKDDGGVYNVEEKHFNPHKLEVPEELVNLGIVDKCGNIVCEQEISVKNPLDTDGQPILEKGHIHNDFNEGTCR